MQVASNGPGYGRVAVTLHWVSAVLILAMFPLGFLMQETDGGAKLLMYRAHSAIGGLILLLTIVRVGWKWRDARLAPPPGLTGWHLRGMEVIHVLLYVVLFALAGSGIALVVQAGLLDALRGGGENHVPKLGEVGARNVHGVLAWVYLGLLVAHIGGVAVHQVRHGQVLARMGIRKQRT